ncbi:nickel transport ATP-binding protein NikD [Klebsiella pneumoniae]|uniref:ABC-type dipeptide transporter n=1 Tax=Klebsiella pneumoniae TaxID=573 RepID=A0A377VD97_KLEPN|nr:nickel transport ATP-binding protein NikD [Klebsiella pneumoniae]
MPADRPLVSDVSFTLRRGQVLALLGSSGCGKSLTCAAALGLLPPGVRQTAGRVLLDGIPVHGEQLRGATIATIMQNPRSAFNPLQTMAAHARETCRAVGREANDAVLLAAMEEVGLDNPRALLKRYPFEMSGGMLQRMMVALALLSRAPFIIADEPTTDLDAIAQARILDLLADIVARRGLGLLLVTHDMGVVARLAHHVTVMENGRLVEHCDVNTLFSAPRHPLSQRLLAAHLALYAWRKHHEFTQRRRGESRLSSPRQSPARDTTRHRPRRNGGPARTQRLWEKHPGADAGGSGNAAAR